MTKLTKETALKLMLQKYMIPIMSTMIMNTTKRITQAVKISNPEIRKATTKTTKSDRPKDSRASVHIDKYCSK